MRDHFDTLFFDSGTVFPLFSISAVLLPIKSAMRHEKSAGTVRKQSCMCEMFLMPDLHSRGLEKAQKTVKMVFFVHLVHSITSPSPGFLYRIQLPIFDPKSEKIYFFVQKPKKNDNFREKIK